MSLRPVGLEVSLLSFLTSALVVALWSASRPGLYYVFGIVPDTLWKGGWVCPKTCLGVFENRNSLAWPRIEPPCHPARSPITVCCNRCVWKWPIVCRVSDIAVSSGSFGIW